MICAPLESSFDLERRRAERNEKNDKNKLSNIFREMI